MLADPRMEYTPSCSDTTIPAPEDDDVELFADDEASAVALSDSECSSPPSPLFVQTGRRTIWDTPLSSPTLYDASTSPDDDCSSVMGLFAGSDTSLDDEWEGVYDYQHHTIEPERAAHLYSGLCIGVEDDESFLAELSSSDTAPPAATTTTNHSSDGYDHLFTYMVPSCDSLDGDTITDWLDLADNRPTTPKIALHSLFKRSQSCSDLEELDMSSSEDREVDYSSDEGYHEDPPSFLSPHAPSFFPPQWLSDFLPDEPEDNEWDAVSLVDVEGFVDLSSLRKPLSRRPSQRRVADRNELRMVALYREATKAQWMWERLYFSRFCS